jgi:hypothetical protein
LLNINCYGSSKASCIILVQNYKMFYNNMEIHSSCAMVLVIYYQLFSMFDKNFVYILLHIECISFIEIKGINIS